MIYKLYLSGSRVKWYSVINYIAICNTAVIRSLYKTSIWDFLCFTVCFVYVGSWWQCYASVLSKTTVNYRPNAPQPSERGISALNQQIILVLIFASIHPPINISILCRLCGKALGTRLDNILKFITVFFSLFLQFLAGYSISSFSFKALVECRISYLSRGAWYNRHSTPKSPLVFFLNIP